MEASFEGKQRQRQYETPNTPKATQRTSRVFSLAVYSPEGWDLEPYIAIQTADLVPNRISPARSQDLGISCMHIALIRQQRSTGLFFFVLSIGLKTRVLNFEVCFLSAAKVTKLRYCSAKAYPRNCSTRPDVRL